MYCGWSAPSVHVLCVDCDRAVSSRAVGKGRGQLHMRNMRGQHSKKDQHEHPTVILDDIKSKLALSLLAEMVYCLTCSITQCNILLMVVLWSWVILICITGPDMTFTVDWVLKTNYLSIPICMCVFIRILYQSDCDDIKVMGQKCKNNCKKLVCSDCSQPICCQQQQTRRSSHIYDTKSRSRSQKQKRPTVVASLMLIVCLVAKSMQSCFFALPTWYHLVSRSRSSKRAWMYIASVYRHAKFECNSLNIVRDIAS